MINFGAKIRSVSVISPHITFKKAIASGLQGKISQMLVDNLCL